MRSYKRYEGLNISKIPVRPYNSTCRLYNMSIMGDSQISVTYVYTRIKLKDYTHCTCYDRNNT